HALEAHLGRSWREHDDIDIGIRRDDVAAVAGVLTGWDLHVAAAGVLTPWDGRPLSAGRSENNLWGRPSPSSPWMLDVTVGDGTTEEWIYRRDRAIRRPWPDAVLVSPTGVPHLAPELQLLFKSTNRRAKDDLDAVTVLPELEPDRRAWLAAHLPADHPWQSLIVRAGSDAS
ncbi:MAG: amino acid transporter, partial [Actinomycetota bacterium]